MNMVRLSAVTSTERHDATSLVIETANSVGGWTDDMHFFSNLMTSFLLTLPGDMLKTFVATLESGGLKFSDTSQFITLEHSEVPVLLQLTFVHSEPDLIREVPPIPG